MVDLTQQQIESVSGGNPVLVGIAILDFFTGGGYEAAIDFTSGMIEGFVEAGK